MLYIQALPRYTRGQFEMDRSRYKRPEQQKQRQTTKNTFGNYSRPVPKAMPARVQPRPVRAAKVVSAAPKTVAAEAALAPAQPRPSRSMAAMATQSAMSAPAAQVETKAVLARQTPIDMDLPGENSSRWLNSPRFRQARLNFSRGLALTMVMVLTLGGLIFSQSYMKAHKVFRGGAGTAAALQDEVKPELLKGEGRGRVNVLLLGRGGGTHDAPDLTDTIMIASIDPVNKQATLLSVPRDMWVNVPDQGVMKINAAWQSGMYSYLGKRTSSNDPKAVKAGFKTVDQTLKEVLGIDIDYNVLVDFQAFKQAIDTVGGVDINVPADLVDPTMAWENANNPVLAKAGLQHMNGVHALIYSRSRETSSDFARGERQRAVLMALKSRVVSAGTLSNPVKLSKLMNAFSNNVQTDLSLSNANRLYGILKGVKDAGIQSMSLADPNTPLVTTGNMNGQSVVLPKAGLFNYKEIQEYVRNKLQDPYLRRENARVLILNGTEIPGLATAKAEQLKSYGYNVVGTGNTPHPGWVQTTLYDMTHKKKFTKNYLEQRLGASANLSISDSTIKTNGADFVIIIGSNETTNTQN